MNGIVLYLIIFLSKVIENALATLRLIVVANGKKLLGSILQFIIALVWVIVTGSVVTNIMEDPLKIVFFAFGSLVGSYVGSFIEEKMALGSNMLMSVVDYDYGDIISNKLRDEGFAVTVLKGEGKENDKKILMIMVSRKKRHHVVDIIKSINRNAMIVSESATTINGGYSNMDKRL